MSSDYYNLWWNHYPSNSNLLDENIEITNFANKLYLQINYHIVKTNLHYIGLVNVAHSHSQMKYHCHINTCTVPE